MFYFRSNFASQMHLLINHLCAYAKKKAMKAPKARKRTKPTTNRRIVHLQGEWRRRRNRVLRLRTMKLHFLRLRSMQLHFDVVTFNGNIIWRECGVHGDQPVASLITKALERYPLAAGMLWQRYVLLTGTNTMRWHLCLGDYLRPNCHGRVILVRINTRP